MGDLIRTSNHLTLYGDNNRSVDNYTWPPDWVEKGLVVDMESIFPFWPPRDLDIKIDVELVLATNQFLFPTVTPSID